MGSSQSSNEEVQQEETEANLDMEKMSNKVTLMKIELEKTRGITKSETEITGGRTVMRYEKIFVSRATGVKPDISGAIDDFFGAIDSGIDDKGGAAAHSAVGGAKKLVNAAVKQCTENHSSETSETKSFEVVFVNNAFARIDYYLWQQYIVGSGKGFSIDALTESSKVCRILVCDIAVIPTRMLNPEEITFLLSQALHIPNASFKHLLEMSAGLAQVTMLNAVIKSIEDKLLESGITDPSELDCVVDFMGKIADANRKISEAFAKVGEVEHPAYLSEHKVLQPPVQEGGGTEDDE